MPTLARMQPSAMVQGHKLAEANVDENLQSLPTATSSGAASPKAGRARCAALPQHPRLSRNRGASAPPPPSAPPLPSPAGTSRGCCRACMATWGKTGVRGSQRRRDSRSSCAPSALQDRQLSRHPTSSLHPSATPEPHSAPHLIRSCTRSRTWPTVPPPSQPPCLSSTTTAGQASTIRMTRRAAQAMQECSGGPWHACLSHSGMLSCCKLLSKHSGKGSRHG